MAKRKRSVALFEVIHQDKRFDRNGGSLPTPAWWFKGKLAGKAPPPPPKLVRTPIVARIVPAIRGVIPRGAGLKETGAPTGTAVGSLPPANAIAATTLPVAGEAITQGAADSWPVASNVEKFAPLHGSFGRRWSGWPSDLTPASMGIIGGALAVMVLSLGLMHWLHRPTGAAAILAGPAHPEVLDLGVTRTAPRTVAIGTPTLAAAMMPAVSKQINLRQVGQGYALIHLYETQRSANAAAAYLNLHDIACTVEHGISGVEPRLYVVLGLTPFAHAGTSEYAKYIQEIKEAYQKYPGASASAKNFKPQWLKWSASSAAGEASGAAAPGAVAAHGQAG